MDIASINCWLLFQMLSSETFPWEKKKLVGPSAFAGKTPTIRVREYIARKKEEKKKKTPSSISLTPALVLANSASRAASGESLLSLFGTKKPGPHTRRINTAFSLLRFLTSSSFAPLNFLREAYIISSPGSWEKKENNEKSYLLFPQRS